MKRNTICFLVLTVLATLLAPATASATEAEATVGVTMSKDDILWVETSLDAGNASSLKVKLFSPKKRAGHRVFQVCRFNFSGAGTYRCGIDVAAGSIATKAEGSWKVRVLIDGEVANREGFSL